MGFLIDCFRVRPVNPIGIEDMRVNEIVAIAPFGAAASRLDGAERADASAAAPQGRQP